MNNTVIGYVDGSPSTRSVCEYAAWAARSLNSSLALMHVIEKNNNPAVSDLTGTLGIDSQQLLIDELVKVEGVRNRLLMAQGKAILSGCAELLQQSGYPDLVLLQKHGAPDEILTEELNDICITVLGKRGTQHQVGSHLENIIRLQKKPLLVVPEKYSTPTRAMIAYDGSDESRKNLLRLTVSPLLKNLICHIVMVNGEDVELRTAQKILHDAGVEAKTICLSSTSISDELICYAKDHGMDLVVMGAYGHSRLRQFFLGSNTAEILQKTSQPLLILR